MASRLLKAPDTHHEAARPEDGPHRGEYPYTVQGHVDWLNARVAAGKSHQRWETFTQRNTITGNDELSCRPVSMANRKPVEAVKPYVPVITKKLDW